MPGGFEIINTNPTNSGAITAADNGLTDNAGTVEFGGALTKNTAVTVSGHTLEIGNIGITDNEAQTVGTTANPDPTGGLDGDINIPNTGAGLESWNVDAVTYGKIRPLNATNDTEIANAAVGGRVFIKVSGGVAGTEIDAVQINQNGRVQVGLLPASDIASAILALNSTTSAFLMPRMTNTQMNAISSPVNGSLIYNTTTNAPYIRVSGTWVSLLTSVTVYPVIAFSSNATTTISGTGAITATYSNTANRKSFRFNVSVFCNSITSGAPGINVTVSSYSVSGNKLFVTTLFLQGAVTANSTLVANNGYNYPPVVIPSNNSSVITMSINGVGLVTDVANIDYQFNLEWLT